MTCCLVWCSIFLYFLCTSMVVFGDPPVLSGRSYIPLAPKPPLPSPPPPSLPHRSTTLYCRNPVLHSRHDERQAVYNGRHISQIVSAPPLPSPRIRAHIPATYDVVLLDLVTAEQLVLCCTSSRKTGSNNEVVP